MFDKLQVCAVAVRLLAPKIGEIRRETRERERDKSFAGLPPSVVESSWGSSFRTVAV